MVEYTVRKEDSEMIAVRFCRHWRDGKYVLAVYPLGVDFKTVVYKVWNTQSGVLSSIDSTITLPGLIFVTPENALHKIQHILTFS